MTCVLRRRYAHGRENAVLHRRAGGAVPVRIHLPRTVRVHGGTEEGAGRQGPRAAGDAVRHGQDHHGAVADRRVHGQAPGQAGQAVVQHAYAVRDREGRGGAARAVRLLRGEQVRRRRAGRGAVRAQEPVRAPVRGRRAQRPRGGRPVSRAHRAVRARPSRGRRGRGRVHVLREARLAGPGCRAPGGHLQRGGPAQSGHRPGCVSVLRGAADARACQRGHIQLPLSAGPEDRGHSVQGLQQEHRGGV